MKRLIILLGLCIGVHFFVYGIEDELKSSDGKIIYSYQYLRTLIEQNKVDELKKFAEEYKLPGYVAEKNNAEDAVNRFINSGRRWRFAKENKWHQREEVEKKPISNKTIKNYKMFYIKESLDKINDVQKYLRTNTTYYADNCSKPIEENDAEKWFLDLEKIKKNIGENEKLENKNIINLIKRIPLDEKFDICQKDFKDVVKKEEKGSMINSFLIKCNDEIKKDLLSLDNDDQDVNLTLRLPQIRKLRSHTVFLKNLNEYTKSLLDLLGMDFTQGSEIKWKNGVNSADQIKKLKDNQYYQVLFNRLLKSLKVFGKDDDFNRIYEFLSKESIIDKNAKYFSVIKNIKLLDKDNEENNENIFNHRLSALMGMRTGEEGKEKEIKNEVHQLYKYERKNIRTAFRVANSAIEEVGANPYTIFKNLLLEMVHNKQLDSKSMYYALEAAKINPNFKKAADADEENDRKDKDSSDEDNDKKNLTHHLDNLFDNKEIYQDYVIDSDEKKYNFLIANDLIRGCFSNVDDSNFETQYGIKKSDMGKEVKWEDLKIKSDKKEEFSGKIKECVESLRPKNRGKDNAQLMSLLSYEMGNAFREKNKENSNWKNFNNDSLNKLQFIAGTYDLGRDFVGQKKEDVGKRSIEKLKLESSALSDDEKGVYSNYGNRELAEGQIPSLYSMIINDVDLIGNALLSGGKPDYSKLKLVKGGDWDNKKLEWILKACLFKENQKDQKKKYSQLLEEWKKFDFNNMKEEDKKTLKRCATRMGIEKTGNQQIDSLFTLNKPQEEIRIDKNNVTQLIDELFKQFPSNEQDRFLFMAKNSMEKICFPENDYKDNKLGNYETLIKYIETFNEESKVEGIRDETTIGSHYDDIMKQVSLCIDKQRGRSLIWTIAAKKMIPLLKDNGFKEKENSDAEAMFLLAMESILDKKFKDKEKNYDNIKVKIGTSQFERYKKIIEDEKNNVEIKKEDDDYLLKSLLRYLKNARGSIINGRENNAILFNFNLNSASNKQLKTLMRTLCREESLYLHRGNDERGAISTYEKEFDQYDKIDRSLVEKANNECNSIFKED